MAENQRCVRQGAGAEACGAECCQLGSDVAGFRGTKYGEQGQSVLPVVPGLAVVAGNVIGTGQAVVRAGLLIRVADPAGQGERGIVLNAGLAGLAYREQHSTSAVACLDLTGPVAGLPGQGEGLTVVLSCPVIAATSRVGNTESGERGRLTLVITDLAKQNQRLVQVPAGLLVVPPQAAPVQSSRNRCQDPAARPVRAVAGFRGEESRCCGGAA